MTRSRPYGMVRETIAALRARLLDGGDPVSAQDLDSLRCDPRAAARSLHEVLSRRAARALDERRRLEAMLCHERRLWQAGVTEVAGVDEAGMGPLAGPVVAAAVMFAPGVAIPGVDDSKRLDARRRESLDGEIRASAAGVGLGVAGVEEIDRLNIHQAGLRAMKRAVEALPRQPRHVLVDARTIPELPVPQGAYVGGDGLSFSIAAASIVAKTHRDRLMRALDAVHPGYGFAIHKGYDTPAHRAALMKLGPCAAHRRSFAAIGEICGDCSARFYELRDALQRAGDRAAFAAFEDSLVAARLDGLSATETRKLRILAARRRKLIGRRAPPV